jgi:hypothetical protein
MTAKQFFGLIIICTIINVAWSLAEQEGFKAGWKRMKYSYVLCALWMSIYEVLNLNLYD